MSSSIGLLKVSASAGLLLHRRGPSGHRAMPSSGGFPLDGRGLPTCKDRKSSRLSMVRVRAMADETKDTPNVVPVGQTKGAGETKLPSSDVEMAQFVSLAPRSPMKTMRHMLDSMEQLVGDSMLFPLLHQPFRPVWDFKEEENLIKMRLDMPGLSHEKVKLTVDGEFLIIRRDIPPSGENPWFNKNVGSSDTRLILPDYCDKKNIRAWLKDGVLFIDIPKINIERKSFPIDVE